MYRSLITLLFAFATPVFASSSDSPLAPDWTLATAEGVKVNLEQQVQKQTTILFFWATWCPYCKALMPHLQSVRLEFGEKVRILAINVKEDGDPVAFMANAGYDFTLLLDGDKVADQYDVTGTPGVFIIDKHRRIRFDLRKLPRPALPKTDKPVSNGSKAAYLAPYWAAEIRKHLDAVLQEQ